MPGRPHAPVCSVHEGDKFDIYVYLYILYNNISNCSLALEKQPFLISSRLVRFGSAAKEN